MSTTTTSTSTTLDRDESLEQAENILRILTFDHRWCASCYRRIREVEHPDLLSGGKKAPDWLIGFSYPTEFTTNGMDTVNSPHFDTEINEDTTVGETYVQRQMCECGAVHHTTRDRPLSKDRLIDYTRNLSEAVDDLREEYLLGSDAKVEKARKWDHDTDVLLYAVGELKSNPDLQFRDQDILERGLAIALRRSSE